MNKNIVKGKNGITVEVVQHSCDANNAKNQVITFNVKYGLIVHAEALRHRLFSRCVKSNRAIPMHLIRKEVIKEPYVPVWFGSKQKGMVADVEIKFKKTGSVLWRLGRYPACGLHWILEKVGAHKEWANRLLNPWQFVRETITYTEGDNFYNLRIHKDAQKDIKELAECMFKAYQQSTPMKLTYGEWHLPYVDSRVVEGKIKYFDSDGTELSTEGAIKCSAARCARSSYDKHDKTMPLAKDDIPLYNQLIESDPAHASPVEHPCTVMPEFDWQSDWPDGVTHVDKNKKGWSGNYKGWIQYRQLLTNHTCWDYKPK